MLGEERRKGKGWEGGQCEHVGRLSPCGSSGVPSGDAREGKLQHLPFSFPLCFPTRLFPHLSFSFFFFFISYMRLDAPGFGKIGGNKRLIPPFTSLPGTSVYIPPEPGCQAKPR